MNSLCSHTLIKHHTDIIIRELHIVSLGMISQSHTWFHWLKYGHFNILVTARNTTTYVRTLAIPYTGKLWLPHTTMFIGRIWCFGCSLAGLKFYAHRIRVVLAVKIIIHNPRERTAKLYLRYNTYNYFYRGSYFWNNYGHLAIPAKLQCTLS